MSPRTDSGTLAPEVSDKDHAEGAANAAVTLVEYGDYECSYCGMAFPIVKMMQQKMGKDLRLVFRNFPLREAHPHAQHAAIAAEVVAAHDAKNFWSMHDALYSHQNALEDSDLAKYAEQFGVKSGELSKAYEGGDAADRVRTDFRSGVRSGVNGTPSFFINGERFDGDWRDGNAFFAALQNAAR